MKKPRSQKSNTSRKADLVRISRSSVRYLAEIAFSGIESNTSAEGKTRADKYHNALAECAGCEECERYVVEDAVQYRAAMIALGKGQDLRNPMEVVAETKQNNMFTVDGERHELPARMAGMLRDAAAGDSVLAVNILRVLLAKKPSDQSVYLFWRSLLMEGAAISKVNGTWTKVATAA